MTGKSVTILGAGPAGLFAALTLAEKHPDLHITLIEKESEPGGITASFTYRGLRFDYGSHRLHPATSPAILEKMRDILGDDLLRRPRHGRIWLLHRFLSFPLKPFELLLKLPVAFSAGAARDMLTGFFRKGSKGSTFHETLLKGLGKTISNYFYFPYAEKLWGLPPEKLSPVQAKKRIASDSMGKMAAKVLSSLLGRKVSGGYFYYPSGGFGEIAEKVSSRLTDMGARVILSTEVVSVVPPGDIPGSVILSDGTVIHSDFILSTIPVNRLVKSILPDVPEAVLKAAGNLSFRAMVFLYLELSGSSYSEYDAHYFPEKDLCFSRLSEPKNYSMASSPENRTGLCFEIPCTEGDELWRMGREELVEKVLEELSTTDLPQPDILSSVLRRNKTVYPVYDLAFEKNLLVVEKWLETLHGTVSLGRQGLFVHDNTHHTIEMGMAAAECLDGSLNWDHGKWADYRRLFQSHVVVD